MGRLLKLREVFNQKLEKADRLSVNDFIVKASALALRDNPEVNAAWMGEAIRQSVFYVFNFPKLVSIRLFLGIQGQTSVSL